MTTHLRIASFMSNLTDWNGDARLFKLDPPTRTTRYEGLDEIEVTYDHVVVSAVTSPRSGPETLIFGSDENGNVMDFWELTGVRDALDHTGALKLLGYEAVS